MKNEHLLIESAEIAFLSNLRTIDSEIEERKQIIRKCNRTLSNLKEDARNYDVFNLPVNAVEYMLQERKNEIEKLLNLKINISPFKNVVPKVSDLFEAGAIVYDCWGYDQTNIDFYCIVKRSGDFVTLLPMTKKVSAEIGFMTNDNTPAKIDFSENPIRKKLHWYNNKGGFSLRNYSGGGYCRLWDGKEKRSTSYA